jgi:outer membrane autotransporter protein
MVWARGGIFLNRIVNIVTHPLMNHIYALTQNVATGQTQAVPETARTRSKRKVKVGAGATALALLCATPLALAGDTFIDSTGNSVTDTTASVNGGTPASYASPAWNVGGWLFVGDNATGDLTISNGGQVSNGLSTIGYYGSGNGTVTVTGSGSTWTNSGTLRIGYDGTGTLIIENGGQVSSQEGRLGVQASSSVGTVTVTGAGSQWTTNGNVLRVGQYGTGTLIIANGGTVLSGAGFIGEQASSTGSSVTVTGGGNWTSTEVSLNRGGVLNIGNYNGSDTAGTVTTGRIFYGGAGTRGAVNFNQTDNIIFATPIEGNVSVYQRGSGKTTFTTNQAYTNGTFIDSGTLALSGSGSIANSTGVQLANTLGAIFDISGVTASATIKTLNGGGAAGGNVVLGSKTLVVELNGNGFYDGVISGTGGLTKSNAGTLRLTGNHTYSGGTSILGGTLLVGAGGTTGSIIGDVTNNAALVFNRSDALTFSGVVSGSGTLGKQGAGTLTLTGNSTYSGGTTISGGALQIGAGGTSGAISGNVTNNAALVFNRSDALTFSGVVNGSGTLEKQGAGTLTLTGNSTYSGGTTISGGTLKVGAGGTAGSLAGDIANNAALIFDRSDAIDFAGVVSGNGTLEKQGAGTLTLIGNNTYSGGTTISSGTLQIGNGGIAGAIGGDVVNNAALIFNRSDALTFAGNIGGTGTLEKQGADTLTLTGNNTYSGATTVSGGTLLVNGSSANSAVTIGSGGTLGGSGTVGSTTVQSGGTLAPGNSPGLLTVAGNLTLNAGSVTRMEIDGATRGTQYDAIDVTGTATLAGTLDLVFGYMPTAGTQYNLINAGTLTGNFANITNNLGAGLLATAQVGANDYDILISLAQQSYVGVSGPLTANQRAVATNLDTFSTSGQAADLIGALNGLLAGDLPPAFDALSGVEHTFASPLAFGAARQFHGLLGARGANVGAKVGAGGTASTATFAGMRGLAAGDAPAQDGFWMRALAADGRIDGDRNAAGTKTSGGGLALGADRRMNANWLAGAAFAYGASQADAKNGAVDLDSYQLAAYARWQGERYYVDGSFALGRHRADSRRTIAPMNARAKAKYDADSVSFAIEAGRPIERGHATLTPYVGLEGSALRREGFTETGAGGANLRVNGRTDDSLRSIVGARYQWNGTRFAPSVEAAWVREFGDDKARIDARFAAVPSAPTFTAHGPQRERDRLRLGLGLTAWAGKNARLDIAWNGEFAGSDQDHTAAATARWVW